MNPVDMLNNSKEWKILEKNLTSTEVKKYIKQSIPKSKAYQTNTKVCCNMCTHEESDNISPNHKIKRQYRKCIIQDYEMLHSGVKCDVKYKIDYCNSANIARIYMSGEHTHALNYKYNNANGMDDKVKHAISDILKNNIRQYPKMIRKSLNTRRKDYGLEHVDIPELRKIQSYVYRQRRNVKSRNSRMTDVKQFIVDNYYFPTIEESQPFFFGLKFDSQSKPVLGDGSQLEPVYLFMTSLKLLKNADTTSQNETALFHLSATHKRVLNSFGIHVFGRTDLNRKFYPVALGYQSREESDDYVVLFQALKNVCAHFNVNFKLKFLMINDCEAQSRAVRTIYPECVVLTCWMNLKIKIRRRLLPAFAQHHCKIIQDIDALHYLRNLNEFLDNKKRILAEWSSLASSQLAVFKAYFVRQWLESEWCNWQIFNTPPGFASTNESLDAFKKKIKRKYIGYERYSVLDGCKMMHEILREVSLTQTCDISLQIETNPALVEEAQTCVTTDFYVADVNLVYYKNNKYWITFRPSFCSCSWFLDLGGCKHFIAACSLFRRQSL